jgi:hypothetical protein
MDTINSNAVPTCDELVLVFLLVLVLLLFLNHGSSAFAELTARQAWMIRMKRNDKAA